jgi:hypothetical protein
MLPADTAAHIHTNPTKPARHMFVLAVQVRVTADVQVVHETLEAMPVLLTSLPPAPYRMSVGTAPGMLQSQGSTYTHPFHMPGVQ